MIAACIILIILLLAGSLFAGVIFASANDYKKTHKDKK